MGICDICGKPEKGTHISSEDMRKAVFKNNFNPYALGLIKVHHMYSLNDEEIYQGWKRDIVAPDQSDWNICSECMSILESYLDGSFTPTGVSSSEVRLFSGEKAAAEKEAKQKITAVSPILNWVPLTIAIGFIILGLVLLITHPPPNDASLVGVALIVMGASLFLRSFRPPVGFIRGLVTLVGGCFAGSFVWSLIMQFVGDQGRNISFGSLVLSIFLLWIGFRRLKA